MLKNKTAELNNLPGNRDWIVEEQTLPLSWSPSDVQREIPHTGTLYGLIWITTASTVSQQAAKKG